MVKTKYFPNQDSISYIIKLILLSHGVWIGFLMPFNVSCGFPEQSAVCQLRCVFVNLAVGGGLLLVNPACKCINKLDQY